MAGGFRNFGMDFSFRDMSRKGVDSAVNSMQKLGRAMHAVSASSAHTRDSMRDLSDSLAMLGRVAATAWTVGNMVKPVAAYSNSLREAIAYNQETIRNVERLNMIQRSMGYTFQDVAVMAGKSTDEVMGTFTELTKQGLNSREAFAALVPVAKLASVSGQTMVEAADLASKAINTMGVNSGQLNELFNMMSVAVNKTELGFEELTDIIGRSASAFAVARPNIEDYLFVMARARNTAESAAVTGTQVRRAYEMMADKNEDVSATLGIATMRSTEYGLKLRDMSDMMVEVAENSMRTTGGLAEFEKRTAALNSIVGTRAYKPIAGMVIHMRKSREEVLSLTTGITDAMASAKGYADLQDMQTKLTIDYFNELKVAIRNANKAKGEGKGDETLSGMMRALDQDNLQRSWERMKVVFGQLRVEAFKSFIPVMNTTIQMVTDLAIGVRKVMTFFNSIADKVRHMLPGVTGFATKMAAIAGVLVAMKVGFIVIASKVKLMMSVGKFLLGNWTALTKSSDGVKGAAEGTLHALQKQSTEIAKIIGQNTVRMNQEKGIAAAASGGTQMSLPFDKGYEPKQLELPFGQAEPKAKAKRGGVVGKIFDKASSLLAVVAPFFTKVVGKLAPIGLQLGRVFNIFKPIAMAIWRVGKLFSPAGLIFTAATMIGGYLWEFNNKVDDLDAQANASNFSARIKNMVESVDRLAAAIKQNTAELKSLMETPTTGVDYKEIGKMDKGVSGFDISSVAGQGNRDMLEGSKSAYKQFRGMFDEAMAKAATNELSKKEFEALQEQWRQSSPILDMVAKADPDKYKDVVDYMQNMMVELGTATDATEGRARVMDEAFDRGINERLGPLAFQIEKQYRLKPSEQEAQLQENRENQFQTMAEDLLLAAAKEGTRGGGLFSSVADAGMGAWKWMTGKGPGKYVDEEASASYAREMLDGNEKLGTYIETVYGSKENFIETAKSMASKTDASKRGAATTDDLGLTTYARHADDAALLRETMKDLRTAQDEVRKSLETKVLNVRLVDDIGDAVSKSASTSTARSLTPGSN